MGEREAADPYSGAMPAYGSAEDTVATPVTVPVAPDAPEVPDARHAGASGAVPPAAVSQDVVPDPYVGPGPSNDVVLEALASMSSQLSELIRLRVRDVDLADRLYAENTRLRTGEFAAAVAPLHSGLLRLHDQMTSLADGDPASVAGMLRIQLLQILDTAAGLSPFEPRPGDRFDSSRQAGVGRAVTVDPAAEGTVAKSIKPGFERADGSVVRVAQVEVYRFQSR